MDNFQSTVKTFSVIDFNVSIRAMDISVIYGGLLNSSAIAKSMDLFEQYSKTEKLKTFWQRLVLMKLI